MDRADDETPRSKRYEICPIFGNADVSKVLNKLRLAECMKSEASYIEDQPLAQAAASPSPVVELLVPVVPDTTPCSVCKVTFETQFEHRQHYKDAWHLYNLKLGRKSLKGVTEEEFNELIAKRNERNKLNVDRNSDADDVSSISGSETSLSSSEKDSADVELTRTVRHAKVFFVNSENKILSLYRCILHGKEDVPSSNEALYELAQTCQTRSKWAVILLGGGHFAAAIFDGNKTVLHKTFHSYTVRAKQGGSQSARDGKSGTNHPKSAGASLRRYNEQALRQHIIDIMGAWKEELSSCDSIFLRAVSHNRNFVFTGKNSVLQKNDPRIKSIPFPTRRATFKEVTRVHEILSSIEIYGDAEDFLDNFPDAPKASSKKPEKPLPSENAEESKPKRGIERDRSRDPPERPLPDLVEQMALSSSSEEDDGDEDEMIETQQVFDCTEDLLEFGDDVPEKERRRPKRRPKKKKKKVMEKEKDESAVAEAFSESGIVWKTLLFTSRHDTTVMQDILRSKSDVDEEEFLLILHGPIDTRGNNLLHEAANQGLLDRVRLLLECGLDPSVPNKEGKVPYRVAKDNDTRKIFRRFQADFPEKYNYAKAHVPGPLTDEIELRENEMQAEIKKAKRNAKKEKLAERKKAEEEKRKEEEGLRKELEAQERFAKLSDREKDTMLLMVGSDEH
ncbi:Hypothetical predicted protein [Cloeon dipterum]|uniref:VLRF1 domain-containing protein n=1 Tax=Cloeon dipterum TaxID=197152 RepID=A0A8S1D2P0_9INSE|nr:Hypothetical predicted protein [Cloeon dipterum]